MILGSVDSSGNLMSQFIHEPIKGLTTKLSGQVIEFVRQKKRRAETESRRRIETEPIKNVERGRKTDTETKRKATLLTFLAMSCSL